MELSVHAHSHSSAARLITHFFNNGIGIMKSSTIQRENVTEERLQPLLQQMFKMASYSMDAKPEDVISICQSPHHRQLSTVHQTRLHSGAAAVGLSKVSKILQDRLCLSFCWKFFHGSVSFKS